MTREICTRLAHNLRTFHCSGSRALRPSALRPSFASGPSLARLGLHLGPDAHHLPQPRRSLVGPEALEPEAMVAKVAPQVLDLPARLACCVGIWVCLGGHRADPISRRCAEERGRWADKGRALEIAIAPRGERLHLRMGRGRPTGRRGWARRRARGRVAAGAEAREPTCGDSHSARQKPHSSSTRYPSGLMAG